MSEFVRSAIAQAFQAHGIPSHVSQSRVHVGSAVQVHVSKQVHARRPEGITIQLDVRTEAACLGKSGPILESFAGIGATEVDAEKNAFGKFLLASFHVLAESVTIHQCDSAQVEWEKWSARNCSWNVCSGPLFTQATVECRSQHQYAKILLQIQSQFLRQAMPGPHWMRVFVGFLHGKVYGIEAILDGQEWAEAQEILQRAPWAPSQEYESLRHLLVAVPFVRADAPSAVPTG